MSFSRLVDGSLVLSGHDLTSGTSLSINLAIMVMSTDRLLIVVGISGRVMGEWMIHDLSYVIFFV